MLAGFHKYLVDNGWTRKKFQFKEWSEDYENMAVSTYGPIEYRYEKDGKMVSWGLVEKDLPPRWSFDPKRRTNGMDNEEIFKMIDSPMFTMIINGVEVAA